MCVSECVCEVVCVFLSVCVWGAVCVSECVWGVVYVFLSVCGGCLRCCWHILRMLNCSHILHSLTFC